MKKLMLCAAAVAGLTVAGGAFAQSADCNRGMMGHDPCGATGQAIPIPPNGGGGAGYTYDGRGYQPHDGRYYWPSQILGAGVYPYGYQYPQQVVPQYNASRRDRDGDGVRNNRDRHPDDPRYR